MFYLLWIYSLIFFIRKLASNSISIPLEFDSVLPAVIQEKFYSIFRTCVLLESNGEFADDLLVFDLTDIHHYI